MQNRINNLRKMMKENHLDAFIINSKANRYYISGFTGTYSRLIIDSEKAYVIADGRYFYQLKNQAPDFIIIDNKMNMTATLVDFISDCNYKRIGIESQEMDVDEYLQLTLNKSVELVPTYNFVEQLRMCKDEEEIARIKKATDISAKALKHIQKYIHPGLTEKEVAVELDNYGVSIGADARAFETIVASGERSALPHGHASNKIIRDTDTIVIDFGFEVNHYYSDVTRTFHFGKYNSKIKEIYEINLEAQQAAIDICEQDMPLKEIDNEARSIIFKYGYGECFLHGLGHGIGLTVHEFPLLNQASTAKLKYGMTFTTEPGIYLEGIGGVRIEDDQYFRLDGSVEQLTTIPKNWDDFLLES